MTKNVAVIVKDRSRFARWVAQQGSSDPEATYHCVNTIESVEKLPEGGPDSVIFVDDCLPIDAEEIESLIHLRHEASRA